MATQEPNVYAGLAVVIGGLMHARPNFFAKVMGELLFWVGEDKMLFGSDYAIWEPKWQVEGLLDWEMPDLPEYGDYPRLGDAGKRKILGLNGAKLYDVEVPESLAPAEAEAEAALARERGGGRVRLTFRRRVLDELGTVYDPELDEPITALGFVGSCEVSAGGDVSVRLRLPTPQCAPNFAFLMAADTQAAIHRVPGVRSVRVQLEDHYTGREINTAVARGEGFAAAFRERRAPSSTSCGRSSSARRSLRARGGCSARCPTPRPRACGTCPVPTPDAAARCAGHSASTRRTMRPPSSEATGRPRSAPTSSSASSAWRGSRPCRSRRTAACAATCCGPGIRKANGRRWPYEGRATARVPPAAQARRGRRARGPRTARRGGAHRRSRPLPHRSAHPGGAVGREVPGGAALYPGTRTPAGSTSSARV